MQRIRQACKAWGVLTISRWCLASSLQVHHQHEGQKPFCTLSETPPECWEIGRMKCGHALLRTVINCPLHKQRHCLWEMQSIQACKAWNMLTMSRWCLASSLQAHQHWGRSCRSSFVLHKFLTTWWSEMWACTKECFSSRKLVHFMQHCHCCCTLFVTTTLNIWFTAAYTIHHRPTLIALQSMGGNYNWHMTHSADYFAERYLWCCHWQ